MALGDPYATLTDVKDYIRIPNAGNDFDALLTHAIESISQEIERHCNRQFNNTTTPSARTYEPTTPYWSYVDDFHTTAGLVVKVDADGDGVFETTVPASDYELEPFNGIVDGQEGWPFQKISLLGGYFPRYARRKGVLQVTAQWGWEAVPEPVISAFRILVAETFQLKDAPFGVVGSDQFGNVLRVRDNRMASAKLARYVRSRVMVG